MNVVKATQSSGELCKRAQAFVEQVMQVKQKKGHSEEVLELLREEQFMKEVDFLRLRLSEDPALSDPSPNNSKNALVINTIFLSGTLFTADAVFNKASKCPVFSGNEKGIWICIDEFLTKIKKNLLNLQYVDMPPEASTQQSYHAKLNWLKASKRLVSKVSSAKVESRDEKVLLNLLCNPKFIRKVGELHKRLQQEEIKLKGVHITDLSEYLSHCLDSTLHLLLKLMELQQAVQNQVVIEIPKERKQVRACLLACRKVFDSL